MTGDLNHRLRNPAWSHSSGDCFLDEETCIADMKEAADEIERLQGAKRRALAVADERVKEANDLRVRIELLENALRAIKRATVNGDVCDDVAWFDQIETLHDFRDRILTP